MLHVWYIYLQNWVILFGQMLINSSTTVRIWGRKPWFGIGFDPCLADAFQRQVVLRRCRQWPLVAQMYEVQLASHSNPGFV